MNYLLDTNVLSETVRRNPNKTVISWLDKIPGEALYLSVLTLGEIQKGIALLADSRRKEKLASWLEHDLAAWFNGRILEIDAAVAHRWGRMLGEIRRPVPTIDSLLAATALQHELALVTRNSIDFTVPGLEVINPWG